jgi:hypothetical protein
VRTSASVASVMRSGMTSGFGRGRDQSGRLCDAVIGARKLMLVDIGLDKIAGTGRERAATLGRALHHLACNILGDATVRFRSMWQAGQL